MIQYYETDWEFILRLASRENAFVIPSPHTPCASAQIGLAKDDEIKKIVDCDYSWCLEKDRSQDSFYTRSNYAFYEIVSYEPLNVGDYVLFHNKKLYIYSVQAVLKHGILEFICRLCARAAFYPKLIYNAKFKGISLIGKVIGRHAEKLKLHLNIDETQDTGTAYEYMWLPETGNILYCMPEMETIVSLYMQSEDEQSAISINSVRLNGAFCPQTQDPNTRYLTTDHEKSVMLAPQSMEFTSISGSTSVSLDDGSGIVMNTSSQLSICAEGDLTVNGASVSMNAPQEITAVKRKLGSPSVINLCNNVDISGAYTKFQGNGKAIPSLGAKQGKFSSEMRHIEGGINKLSEYEQRMKLGFKMMELLDNSYKEESFDILDILPSIISSIPKNTEEDELSRITVGLMTTI